MIHLDESQACLSGSIMQDMLIRFRHSHRSYIMSDDQGSRPLADVTLRPAAEEAHETYIGHGCYASFDGYQIKLRAPRDYGDHDHEVYLEPPVFKSLLEFARLHWRV